MHNESRFDTSEHYHNFNSVLKSDPSENLFHGTFQPSSYSKYGDNRFYESYLNSKNLEESKKRQETSAFELKLYSSSGFDQSLNRSSQNLPAENFSNSHDKIFKLENLLEQKEAMITELKYQKSAMASEIDDLMSRIKEKDYQQEAEVKKYTAKIEELNFQFHESENFIKSLQEDLKKSQKVYQDSSDGLSAIIAENKSLRSKVESLSHSSKLLETQLKQSEPTSSKSEFAAFKFQQQIKKLEEDNENLSMALNSRPTFKDLKDKDLIISELKQRSHRSRTRSVSQPRDQNRESIRKDKELFTLTDGEPPSLSTMNLLLKQLTEILKVNNFKEIVPSVIRLKKKKKTQDLEEKLEKLVKDLSPEGSFHPVPSPSQIWKWIRRVVEEYLTLKKNFEREEKNKAIINRLLGALGIVESSEIIKEVNVLIGESHANYAIREKIDLILESDPKAMLKDFKYLINEIL